MIRYADLFCGIGAFHQAFKKHDAFSCVMASDINEGVRRIYEANYGISPLGDIRKVNESSLPDLDLVCAGIPCQSFSIAGRKQGFGDSNGNLFWELLRIVKAKKPHMVIVENVKNLENHDKGETFRTIKDSFEDLGYKFFSRVLNSSHYGSPQSRQRIFMVAVLSGDFTFPERLKHSVCVSSILENGLGSLSLKDYELVKKESSPKPFRPRILFNIFSKDTGKGGRQGERIYDPECCGITVCATSGGPGAKTGLYKVGEGVRRLSPRECLSMFGFPDDFDFLGFPDEQKIFYLGNSIVVNVVESLVPSILDNFSSSGRI